MPALEEAPAIQWDNEVKAAPGPTPTSASIQWDDEVPPAPRTAYRDEPQAAPAYTPDASVSAHTPTLKEKLQGAIGNSAIGHSVTETMPKVADALGIRPTASTSNPQAAQDAQQLIAPEYLANPGQNRLRGALSALGGLTSADNLALMTGTAATAGAAAGVVNPVSAQLLSRLVSGGFTLDMLNGLYGQSKAYRQAVDRGDTAEAQRLQGSMGINGVMALLSGAHAAGVGAHAGRPTSSGQVPPTDVEIPRQRALPTGAKPPVELPQDRLGLPAPAENTPAALPARAGEAIVWDDQHPTAPPLNQATARTRVQPTELAPNPQPAPPRGFNAAPDGTLVPQPYPLENRQQKIHRWQQRVEQQAAAAVPAEVTPHGRAAEPVATSTPADHILEATATPVPASPELLPQHPAQLPSALSPEPNTERTTQSRQTTAAQPPQDAPIVQFRREAAAIEQSAPPVPPGQTRLWRGNRPGEEGQNPQFTNDLAGIALPFQKAYRGPLTYVDVPTNELATYEQHHGVAPGAEFMLPNDLAASAKTVNTQADPIDTAADSASPHTHLFSPEHWQAAHPGEDIAAATAEARRQGYAIEGDSPESRSITSTPQPQADQPSSDGAVAGSAETSAGNETPDTHVFDPQLWLRKNPGGNVEAATAMARQAGYSVHGDNVPVVSPVRTAAQRWSEYQRSGSTPHEATAETSAAPVSSPVDEARRSFMAAMVPKAARPEPLAGEVADHQHGDVIEDAQATPESGSQASSSSHGSRGPAHDDNPDTNTDPTPHASDLGSQFYSGFADPELFKRLFPDVAERIRDWVDETPNEGDKQRAMMRQSRGEMDRRVAVVMQKLSGSLREWRARPREDSIAFWNAVEQGKVDSLPAKDQALANLFKGGFDQMRGEIQQLKPQALQNYIENYFPHLWDRSAAASDTIRQVLTGKRPFAGKGSFLKQRTIPTMQDGLDLGLKPKTWNPVESFLLKYSEMAQFLMGHQTLAMMKDAGTAKMVRIGERPPDGWTQLDDRIGTVHGYDDNDHLFIRGHYYAPADAARVFNNYVSRGLAGRSGIYDVLNWTNQNLNALQLGVSFFHAATTTINAATSDVALGLQQLAEGKPLQAGQSLAKGFTVAPSMVSTMRNGSRLMREYLEPGSYAKFSAEAKALAEAGGRVGQNTIEIKPLDRAINAWRNGAVKEGLTQIPAAVLDASVRPVMEYYVPRMKLGAFYGMAHDILEQAAAKGWDQKEVRARIQTAWDSVDNRFGQMVYDNLFWHRALRDVLQVATRSVGWNFGDLRELGGAATDTLKQGAKVLGGEKPELTPRMAFGLALPMVSGLIGGVLTYLWTGQKPDTWKDYFYPKTADATRHSIPGYMKDVFSFAHAPVQTTLNKLGPLWELTAEAINNKDFYGTEIRHKDDPLMRQMVEFSSWAAKQAMPFSFSGSAKLLEQRGAEPTLSGMMAAAVKHPTDLLRGQLGFQPAPAFIQNSRALNAARDYERENRPPGTKTKEQTEHSEAFGAVVKMYRTGQIDQEQITRYQKDGKLSGLDLKRAAMEARFAPIILASRNLDIQQLLNVYRMATPDEKTALRPVVARKYKNIAEIPDPDRRQAVVAEYRRVMDDDGSLGAIR